MLVLMIYTGYIVQPVHVCQGRFLYIEFCVHFNTMISMNISDASLSPDPFFWSSWQKSRRGSAEEMGVI